MGLSQATEKHKRHQQITLLFSTFTVAICGLIYELLLGTLSSYLLGDSVYQFSLVIGLFMSSMGVGAWLSRFIHTELPTQFVRLQLLIGFLGGISAPLLFFAFAILGNYTPLLFLLILLLGSMLGIEIPLVIRILKEHFSLKANVSNVFTADYIGALIAALLFPLVLAPQLGLLQSGFLIGTLNAGIGLLALYVFRNEIVGLPKLLVAGALLCTGLITGLLSSDAYVSNMENRLYQDKVIYAEDSPFQQRLVLAKRGDRVRFYINGALQFDSFDEYRYHEALVHPVMGLVNHAENILVLGGGDGLAVRELLHYPSIKKITIVDLDPAVTALFKNKPLLQALNKNSLNDPRIDIINQDAWKFLEGKQQLYDAIFIDLPDPNNISLSRLYSTVFYQLVKQHLTQAGVMVTQATSPLYSHKAFWSINKTLQHNTLQAENQQEWNTLPYHVHIPSFGEWGFVMAARHNIDPENIKLADKNYRFINKATLPQLFEFPADMEKVDVEANQLSTHPLLQYYQAGWKKWYK